MSIAKSEKTTVSSLYFTDSFVQTLSAGEVIGSRNAAGVRRGGVDVERVISTDGGALRIQPLRQPGWGRSGLAYGPYRRENGLAFGVHMLNGHNTSQVGDLGQSIPGRLQRWLLGGETQTIPQRLIAWTRGGHKKHFVRQWQRWIWLNRHYRRVESGLLDENLAVGWFPAENPTDPVAQGNSLIVHATGAENGELWARAADWQLPVLRGLQNIPIYYVVVLRQKGAAYYAASLPGAHGLAAFPLMRPLAIDAFDDAPEVYAGVHQSVLGQIGFRVDSRVYGTAVQKIAALDSWYGTAHLADRLVGNGRLTDSPAEQGGAWRVYQGDFARTAGGARALENDSLAILDAGKPVGLVHALVKLDTPDSEAQLVWRFQDEANYRSLAMRQDRCRLLLRLDGVVAEVGVDEAHGWLADAANSVQIADDGERFSVAVNGRFLFNDWFTDARLQNAGGVGFCGASGGDVALRDLEAHPRAVAVPAEFAFAPSWQPGKRVMAVADNFAGEAADLNGHKTSVGGKVWQKDFGRGTITLRGDEAAGVVGGPTSPNPGRTFYTIPWDDPAFAELEVEVTPPGSVRGDWEHGRGGFVFWQDEHNQLLVNTWLDDSYQGASISSFFYINGFEEIFDAVWSNVGGRIHWGRPYRLRVAFDGVHYMAYVNDEPVLYRALTDVYPQFNRLTIRRVGILANWEWGNDTGTVFRQFTARRKEQ
ncbi:MAG: nucleotide-binding protein [Chloroflexi bacterium]|nr:nucleotide-binding protein [Chloroflexota bacterium]